MDTSKRITISEIGGCVSDSSRSLLLDRCHSLMTGNGNVEGIVIKVQRLDDAEDEVDYLVKVGVLLKGSRLYMRQERFCNVMVASLRVFARIEEHLKRRAELGKWRYPDAALLSV